MGRSVAKGFTAIMRRRQFLEGCGYGLAGLVAAQAGTPAARGAAAPARREIAADLVIVGGGLGGCAAALAALRNGRTVVLTEPTDWIGGQLTAQAVPPDEHPWIEQFGASASYQALRQGIRGYYRRHYPLTADARAIRDFNPGNGSVSRLCHEPRVALAALTAMLAPYASSGRLLVLLEHEPIRVEVQGDRVRAVTVRDRQAGRQRSLVAPYFLDATELGDLLPLAGVEFVTGAEGQAQTGEPHAPPDAQPDNQQAITCCFAVDYLEGQDHTIERPAEYAFWRDFIPALKPSWPGRLLDLTSTDPVTLKPASRGFDPRGAGGGLWVYRRILDPRNFQPGSYPGSAGTTLINWPQNDYWLGPLAGTNVTAAQAQRHVARAKQLSLSLLYWLQTECPRPDGKTGWKGLRLRPDLVGTEDGLAKTPYIRESRRIAGRVHCAGAAREHRGPPSSPQGSGCSSRAVSRQRRGRQLSHRPAPQHRRRQLHRHQLAAVPDPAGRLDPAPGREPAAGVQEPGYDPHHQRLLSPASRRVGHRRGRRRTRGVLPGAERSLRGRSGIQPSAWLRSRRGSSLKASRSPGRG